MLENSIPVQLILKLINLNESEDIKLYYFATNLTLNVHESKCIKDVFINIFFLYAYFVISHVVSDILCRVEREIVSEMLSLFGLSFKFLFLCPLLHVRSYNITVSLFELKALSYMEGTKLTLKKS